MGTECPTYKLFAFMIVWLTGDCACCCYLHHESILLHVSSPGKDPDSKFDVLFLLNVYHFLTIIKSKNQKSNHYNLGTVRIYQYYSLIQYIFIEDLLYIIHCGRYHRRNTKINQAYIYSTSRRFLGKEKKNIYLEYKKGPWLNYVKFEINS